MAAGRRRCAERRLPAGQAANAEKVRFDITGTLLLATALGAYALAMTLGGGHFGGLNISLLAAAILSGGLFVRTQHRRPSPLIPLTMFSDRLLVSGLATSALVATVMMATLLVGPFYLSIALGLPSAIVGLVLAVGPCVAALAGMPAGRLADRFGVRPMRLLGLATMASGCLLLSLVPPTLGIAGYVTAIMVTTLGYAMFQTANNAAVMAEIPANQRGVIAGLLNLSRNLGFFSGAAMLGAVFAAMLPTNGTPSATPEAVADGLHVTFIVALSLVVLAGFIAFKYREPEPLAAFQDTVGRP